MPEGHTIHRLARDHTNWFGGQKLAVASPQGRFADEATLIDGKTLDHASACGKHLFYHFKRAPILHIHLGLYGKYRIHDNPPPGPRGAVRVRMIGKAMTADLNGPNQCKLIDKSEFEAILERLGPDPLRDDADPSRAWARISKSRAPIGQLLMDQAVVAGVGNIYRSEILWRAKIHPKTPGNTILGSQWNEIWKDAVELMTLGVKHNKIITVDPKSVGKPASKLNVRERTNIYKQSKCPRCGAKIDQFALAGRKVYACDGCQT
jgi:endonuclease VIII